MPNRIIKDSIKTSEEIDALDWFQEAMWTRLIVTVDDYGCYEAKPKLLRNVLFPLKDNVTEQMVREALEAYENLGLILLYEHEGKQYLCMKTWADHQRIRTKTKRFPEPPGGYPQPKSERDFHSINGGGSQTGDSKLPPDDSSLQQSAADCGRLPQIATNGGKVRPESNPIQSKKKEKEKNETPPPRSFIDELEAHELSDIHEEIFNAMARAGFQMNDGLRDAAIELFVIHGREKLLYAIEQCVGATGNKLNYLRRVLANLGKPKPGKQEREDDESILKKAFAQAKGGVNVD